MPETYDRELVAALRAAVNWLDSSQPSDALLAARGLQTKRGYLGGEVYASLAPVALGGRPVFIFEREERWSPELDTLLNPFDAPLVGQMRAALIEATYPIYHDWNGIGHCTYSLSLARPAGADVRALVERFRAGCPVHHSFDETHLCDWYLDGRDKVLLPVGWRPRRAARNRALER